MKTSYWTSVSLIFVHDSTSWNIHDFFVICLTEINHFLLIQMKFALIYVKVFLLAMNLTRFSNLDQTCAEKNSFWWFWIYKIVDWNKDWQGFSNSIEHLMDSIVAQIVVSWAAADEDFFLFNFWVFFVSLLVPESPILNPYSFVL